MTLGLHLQLQHARQHQGPRNGAYADKTDVAGLGGDSRFFPPRAMPGTTTIFEDIVGIGRQAEAISWGLAMTICASSTTSSWPAAGRGFASSHRSARHFEPRQPINAIGGTTYVGLSAEVQFLIFGLPREPFEGAVFADAGTLRLQGATIFDVNGNTIIEGFSPTTGCTLSTTSTQECIVVRDSKDIRSSVGASY